MNFTQFVYTLRNVLLITLTSPLIFNILLSVCVCLSVVCIHLCVHLQCFYTPLMLANKNVFIYWFCPLLFGKHWFFVCVSFLWGIRQNDFLSFFACFCYISIIDSISRTVGIDSFSYGPILQPLLTWLVPKQSHREIIQWLKTIYQDYNMYWWKYSFSSVNRAA